MPRFLMSPGTCKTRVLPMIYLARYIKLITKDIKESQGKGVKSFQTKANISSVFFNCLLLHHHQLMSACQVQKTLMHSSG